jgi:hypothetical protein
VRLAHARRTFSPIVWGDARDGPAWDAWMSHVADVPGGELSPVAAYRGHDR